MARFIELEAGGKIGTIYVNPESVSYVQRNLRDPDSALVILLDFRPTYPC